MARIVAARCWSLQGVAARPVTVEAHVCSGLPSITLVGLPDASLREAKERVRAAVSSCGFAPGAARVTINLSPASLPKTGSSFDLAIAVALLWVEQRWDPARLDGVAFLSELGLDGSLRPVRGVLPTLLSGLESDVHTVVVSNQNAAEAALVSTLKVIPFGHLSEVVRHFGGSCKMVSFASSGSKADQVLKYQEPHPNVDFADVRGQDMPKFAMEVAAAGGHNVLMTGVPGSGKTLLASCLPGILPPLGRREALEVTSIHSVVGRPADSLVEIPPFEAPHHGITLAAMVGGGSGQLRPGAVTLAHNGVLFLDEAPEFAPSVLDALRQPIESGSIRIARARGSVVWPARFQLVLAANPCACGNAMSVKQRCTCTPLMRRRYLQRLSGPLLDRVDLRLVVETPTRAQLKQKPPESSAQVLERVMAARSFGRARRERCGVVLNAHLPSRGLLEVCDLESQAVRVLDSQLERGQITMRGRDRIVRLARTIADLRLEDKVNRTAVRDALAMRQSGGSDGCF